MFSLDMFGMVRIRVQMKTLVPWICKDRKSTGKYKLASDDSSPCGGDKNNRR